MFINSFYEGVIVIVCVNMKKQRGEAERPPSSLERTGSLDERQT